MNYLPRIKKSFDEDKDVPKDQFVGQMKTSWKSWPYELLSMLRHPTMQTIDEDDSIRHLVWKLKPQDFKNVCDFHKLNISDAKWEKPLLLEEPKQSKS